MLIILCTRALIVADRVKDALRTTSQPGKQTSDALHGHLEALYDVFQGESELLRHPPIAGFEPELVSKLMALFIGARDGLESALPPWHAFDALDDRRRLHLQGELEAYKRTLGMVEFMVAMVYGDLSTRT